MTRNWEAEWTKLSKKEREAYERMRELFLQQAGGSATDNVMGRFVSATREWQKAVAHVDAFMQEFRASQ